MTASNECDWEMCRKRRACCFYAKSGNRVEFVSFELLSACSQIGGRDNVSEGVGYCMPVIDRGSAGLQLHVLWLLIEQQVIPSPLAT